MSIEPLQYCTPLVEAVTYGFNKRFGHFFDSSDERARAAIVAASVHPFFKIRFLHENLHDGANIKIIEEMLVNEAQRIMKETAGPTKKTENASKKNGVQSEYQFLK